MIKIIEEGTKHINICSDCRCKYSYEKEDIMIEETRYPRGDSKYVKCPQCHERNYIQQAKTSFDLF